MRSTHFAMMFVLSASTSAFAQGAPPPAGPPAGGGVSTSGGPPPGPSSSGQADLPLAGPPVEESRPPLQPAPPPMIVVRHPRVGLELGAGLWAGKMYCESQNGKCSGIAEAGGINVEGSWFFTPELGITLDVWAMAHTENAVTIEHVISTVGVKWRPVPILTLQAGIGDAHANFKYANLTVGTSGDAGAIMGAVDLDIVRGRRWALSIGARAGTGFYGDANNDGKPDITARNVGVGAQLIAFGF